MKMPATRAMMKPASPVSPMAQVRLNLANWSGVAAMTAQLPAAQQMKLMKKTTVNDLTNLPTWPPRNLTPTESIAVMKI